MRIRKHFVNRIRTFPQNRQTFPQNPGTMCTGIPQIGPDQALLASKSAGQDRSHEERTQSGKHAKCPGGCPNSDGGGVAVEQSG